MFRLSLFARWRENLRCQGVACGEGSDQNFLIPKAFWMVLSHQVVA